MRLTRQLANVRGMSALFFQKTTFSETPFRYLKHTVLFCQTPRFRLSFFHQLNLDRHARAKPRWRRRGKTKKGGAQPENALAAHTRRRTSPTKTRTHLSIVFFSAKPNRQGQVEGRAEKKNKRTRPPRSLEAKKKRGGAGETPKGRVALLRRFESKGACRASRHARSCRGRAHSQVRSRTDCGCIKEKGKEGEIKGIGRKNRSRNTK